MVNFDISPNKTATVNLDTSAKLEPRSTLNVAFSTADQDTAMFKFRVTQDNETLHLGEANVESNIYLKHSNGSHISEKLTITDGLNGELGFKLSNDFVKIPGNVTAQVYVARKGNKQAVVAERIFSFTIQKSLAWEFDAETKLVYIIEFNELRERILNRQKEIEDAMENAEDYVSQLKEAREKGLTDIEIAKTDSIKALNDLADKRVNEINENGTKYVDDMTTIHDGMEGKINKFNEDVEAGGYIKEDVTKNWQKYKLVQDDGTRKWVGTLNDKIEDLPAGLYEATIPNDNESVPSDPNGTSYIAAFDIYESSSGHKQIYLIQNFQNRQFVKTIHTSGVDRGWKKVGLIPEIEEFETENGAQTKANKALEDSKLYTESLVYDTGWQPLTVMSNVSLDEDAGASIYRVVNNVCEIRFNITIDRWTDQLPIIQPPVNVRPTSSFSFLARTTGSPGKNPVVISYDFNKGYFKVWTNGDNTLNSGDYIYGHVVYIVGGSLDV